MSTKNSIDEIAYFITLHRNDEGIEYNFYTPAFFIYYDKYKKSQNECDLSNLLHCLSKLLPCLVADE